MNSHNKKSAKKKKKKLKNTDYLKYLINNIIDSQLLPVFRRGVVDSF